LIFLVALFARPAMAANPPTSHVPEPMQFDLVRGLGAKAGEIEGNVLVVVPTSVPTHVEWAPEIEWAPIDNFALELELPMLDHHLEALKLSAQLTLPTPRLFRLAHGLQATARLPFVDEPQAHLIHVVAVSLGSHASLMTMIGPRLTFGDRIAPELLVNGALFVSLPGEHAIGIETTWAGGCGHDDLAILPQVHLSLGRHVRLQLGVGARRSGASDRWAGEAGVRLIVDR
jgi:hypothetical protein